MNGTTLSGSAVRIPSPVDRQSASMVSSTDAVIEMRVGNRTRQTHVHPDLTPLRVWELNVRAVVSCLDEAGIDYFVVRGIGELAPVVGVRDTDRQAVYQALRQRCRDEAAYVTSVLPPNVTPKDLFRAESRATWEGLGDAEVIKVVWFRAEPTGTLVYGQPYGCDIEFWSYDEERDQLVAPRSNMVASRLAASSPIMHTTNERLSALCPRGRHLASPLRTREDFGLLLSEDIDFPVDVVYTWVDGADPEWARRRAQLSGAVYHPEAANDARFISRDELRYSLRSLHAYAPWVRNVYLVTDDQAPAWLDESHPDVQVVSHREIFSDPSVLPTYNSFAIESQLHRIEGLSECFLYLNDDMFLGRPVRPQMFFLANGNSKFFLSQTRVPMGPIDERDTPVDAALKNNRMIISRLFGATITRGTQHVPYALQRSVLAEIEERFPAEHAATMASRFRAMDNLSITYSLHQYYAFHTGRAVPGMVNYGYVHLGVPNLADRLARALVRRDWDAFCLNDAFSTPDQIERQNEVLRPFLDSYFPVPSPYEICDQ